jgi:hypothetical protein
MDLDESFSDSETSTLQRSPGDLSGSSRKTKIVLVKGIPKNTSVEEVKMALGAWGRISRFVKKPFTNHYYLEYEVGQF